MYNEHFRFPDGPFKGRGLYDPAVKAALAAEGISSSGRILGMDSQATLTTTSNNGILAWMANYHDPDALEILFAPLEGAMVFGAGEDGERKIGDMATATSTFTVLERTGLTSAYGDFNNNGSAGYNVNFPQRQSFNFQTILQYGALEVERLSLAQVDAIGAKRNAANWAINQNRNTIYHYGVSGLQNYGILNDPSLPAAIQPGPKAYGAAAHGPWQTSGVPTATPNEIYTDVLTLYTQLISQTQGNVQLNMASKLTLVLPPVSQSALCQTNSFGISAEKLVKENLPNIRFVADPLFATTAGNLVQLIADEVQGQKTGFVAFNEKLRAFPLVPDVSSYKQKIAGGAWGAIIKQGFAIAQMLGV